MEPHKHHGKTKETYEFIFLWLSWQAVLLVGAYDNDGVAQDGSHSAAANRETEKYSLAL